MQGLAIDSHTEGEPTRVLVHGAPELEGKTVADRADSFDRDHDWLRTALVCEPRGHDVLVGAILVPPSTDDADIGVIFVNNVGRLGMCVHGTIGVVRTLQHLDRVSDAPGTRMRIETPVGVVDATVGSSGEIVVENVESYRSHRGIAVDLGDRTVHADVAWGGNWFALVSDHGERVTADRTDALRELSLAIRDGVNRILASEGETAAVDHVELFGPGSSEADSRNFVLCPGGEYDRSPCGTGTSAKLACLAAEGRLQEGDLWVQESIVGSRFTGRWHRSKTPGRIVPHIGGRAWITGELTLVLDADDPYRHGLFTKDDNHSEHRP